MIFNQSDLFFQIMGSYVMMLTTAQTKINFIALESLPRLIVHLHPCLRDTTPQLVPALLKLVSSKQHSKLALDNVDCLVKHVGELMSMVVLMPRLIDFHLFFLRLRFRSPVAHSTLCELCDVHKRESEAYRRRCLNK